MQPDFQMMYSDDGTPPDAVRLEAVRRNVQRYMEYLASSTSATDKEKKLLLSPCLRDLIVDSIYMECRSATALKKYADQKVSTRPMRRPPSTAPGRLPMPPSTAAVNALTPGVKPSAKDTTP